jgi:hypothetical protein
MAYAEELRGEGNDVQVGGVPAYSTLGWFSDPAAVDLHQLPRCRTGAHDVPRAGAPGGVCAGRLASSTRAFATAVEEAGVERWLELLSATSRCARAMPATTCAARTSWTLLLRHRQRARARCLCEQNQHPAQAGGKGAHVRAPEGRLPKTQGKLGRLRRLRPLLRRTADERPPGARWPPTTTTCPGLPRPAPQRGRTFPAFTPPCKK